MPSYDDSHAEWAARVSAHCGHHIKRFDPATQPKIGFHPRPWLRWNGHDSDVAWAPDHYRDGIDRGDLRLLAQDLGTAAKRRRAFVATLIWGAGPTNRYYGRHAKVLASPDLHAILERTVDQVGADDLEGAWRTAAGLPGLGFRFFTKWLWVAGAGQNLLAPPLVFDNQVRTGLRLTHWPWHPRRLNDRRRWVNYCNDAAAVGNRLGVTGEWAEYWLFSGAPGAPCCE
ncbi:hypothetical protein F0Q45_11120 [Mycobacterium simiae]|uniref:Uncharacterized protein n=1 Tax=Mycobacterium simiae TaxID=1784 RepID=A0A5B1BQ72_MYCSI|nr:hypothetical protein [Mycobacterium simiae]KAA1250182.1 hypothetical protein F0Q45_11120 [Mycobacterium simiae]